MKLGVCSWSLEPKSVGELVERVSATGLGSVQLALDPLVEWGLEETRDALGSAGISILSGMMMMSGEDYTTLDSIRDTGGVRGDEHWEANLAAVTRNGKAAAQLGLDLVTFHAGFIPHEAGALRDKMLGRLREVVDRFADCGVRVALETGQESAETLLDALAALDRPEVGVNFDPANMILYGMGDPIAAVDALAPRIAQVHLKDAAPTEAAGEWGTEVVFGTGSVNTDAFFTRVAALDPAVDALIEREAGDQRVTDIAAARAVAEEWLERRSS